MWRDGLDGQLAVTCTFETREKARNCHRLAHNFAIASTASHHRRVRLRIARIDHPVCPECAKTRTTSREAVDAGTHLGLITWTYRDQGNPLRPPGCFVAA